MARKAAKKKSAAPMIAFSRSRDIPFNRIRLSDSNVRETDVEVGLDELTFDIERREDLVQGLNVRAILDEDGNETGDFETPAGGRRYRSIARLVKAGRFPEDGLVPCIVKKADAKTSAVDDSLAENLLRLALHPLDQFRAFKRMVEGGMSTEEVATAYFTTQRYVEQRLRLASVSPKLLEVYAENGMTLAVLETFTAHPDHARQEQVWDAVRQSHYREPWRIRNMLTETTVPASDKRARFIGLDAYIAAGGPVLPRYLFDDEDEGWLEDVALLDRLVSDRLKSVADEIAGEGWKWVTASLELPYGYDYNLRAITGTAAELSDKESREREDLRKEQERLEVEYADYDELPDEIDQRLSEIEKQLEAFERRPTVYDPAEIAIAIAFVSVDEDGELIVDRGYVRPEDEPAETIDGAAPGVDIGGDMDGEAPDVPRSVITIGGQPAEPDEDEQTVKPLPERLVAELTAHRTVALREAVGANPHIAMTALLHKLVRDTFKRNTSGAAFQVSVREVYCGEQGIDLKTSPYAKAVDERHAGWKADLPADDDALWDWLDALDEASRMALLAHCVSYGINALYERPNPHSAMGISESALRRRMTEADRLQRATGLDMVEAGFRPKVANYLGRVTKPRILEAVHEALGEEKARLIDHLKKDDMACEAERLLADSGWLPEPLRMADPDIASDIETETEVEALPAFLADDDEVSTAAEDDAVEHLVAAE
ncbi:ParB/RepB/Spo0J family partition protein [Agrobacterium tumefaciens]|uniref:ParB/RepB/Spo0J family partition protein n=1 Tax=Agrobacterium tumefaciens TaxID=358 RepID=UPI0022436EEF|nr:chromosome partitioning protein ParB [Agrobacterium tumefaciens]MCW8060827.1 chromosome partitioning protein ParB [Agrobacterium tumefaciens]